MTKEQLSVADYEEVLSDHRRLVRELDVLLNGEHGAAKQASLCDIVGQLKRQKYVPSSNERAEFDRWLQSGIYKAADRRVIPGMWDAWQAARGAHETSRRLAGTLNVATGEVTPVCPDCSKPLHKVTRPGGSMLNDDQFDAVRAGDWYCDTCPGNERGNTRYRYFWNREMPSVEPSPPLASEFNAGQRVRFIDQHRDHAEWVVTKVDADWVYLHHSEDRCYTHFAKPIELRAVKATCEHGFQKGSCTFCVHG